MPTFIAFKNGEKVGEVVGAIPQQLEVRSTPPGMCMTHEC